MILRSLIKVHWQFNLVLFYFTFSISTLQNLTLFLLWFHGLPILNESIYQFFLSLVPFIVFPTFLQLFMLLIVFFLLPWVNLKLAFQQHFVKLKVQFVYFSFFTLIIFHFLFYLILGILLFQILFLNLIVRNLISI